MASFSRTTMNPKKFHRSQIKFYVVLIPIVIFMIMPLVYIFSTAFKPLDELFLFPPKFLVQNPTFNNFIDLFTSTGSGVPIARYFFNSIVITGIVVLASILFSSMAGYALSKMYFKGKKAWFELNQLALMFVASAIAIPKYLVVEKLGLVDTIWANIFPIMAIPVGLFLVKQFIDQIPNDLIEAARIDGASEFKIYRKIILPIIKPALATVAILAFQTVWNNVDTSQLYINNDSLKTLAFYMTSIAAAGVGSNNVAGQGMAAAASLIMVVPNIIIFVLLQSKIMNTVAHSGMK